MSYKDRNSSNRGVRKHIYISEWIEDKLQASGKGLSQMVNEIADIMSKNPKFLIEVSCVLDNTIYYTIGDTSIEAKIVRFLATKDAYFSKAFKAFGIGEFNIRVVGIFDKLVDATDIMEYMINRALDRGINCLNREGFNRYVIVKSDVAYLNKVLTKNGLNEMISYLVKCINNDRSEPIASLSVKNKEAIARLASKVAKATRL